MFTLIVSLSTVITLLIAAAAAAMGSRNRRKNMSKFYLRGRSQTRHAGANCGAIGRVVLFRND